MKPHRMGGYVSYFVDNTILSAGYRYKLSLFGYVPWEKGVMTLVRFKQIRSAYHLSQYKVGCGRRINVTSYALLFESLITEHIISLIWVHV